MNNIKTYEGFFSSLNKNSIVSICKKYRIVGYNINKDGSIDTGSIDISNIHLEKLPLKFNKIDGYFIFDSCDLKSLKGSPIEVNEFFSVSNNKLTSFEYAPKTIRGFFYCDYNNIKSFEYFPNYIGGDFICYDNPISEVWDLFRDTTKIELLNDCDIFRDEDTDTPSIIMDRLNDFLLTIGEEEVKDVYQYKNI